MPSDTNNPPALFECRQCGDCCKGYGGTYLTDKDIEAIAGLIGSDVDSFVAQYCTLSGSRLLLAQRSDGYCIFWDGLCRIHAVKPQMCRKWPFIDSLLVDVGNWLIMADSCPGIRTDIPADKLEKYLKQIVLHDRNT
jgi:Fe-S-cluster containining protein